MKNKKNKKILLAVILFLVIIIVAILFLLFFKKPIYKITFDSNGGTEVSTINVKENEKIESPKDPEKEGYIFAGWYYNEELFDFDTIIKQDITLEARWVAQKNADIEGVSLNLENLKLTLNGTGMLVATLSPENAKETKLIWTSSDENIVKVDENGNITALNEGTAIITVKTEEGGFTAECEVTVAKDVVEVQGITISGNKELKVGETITLTANVTPDNATNKQVVWTSSNSYVATVNQNGVIRGLKAGKVTITATTVDGKKVATYVITINSSASTGNLNKNSANANTNNSSNNGGNTKPSTPNIPNTPSTPNTPSIPNTPTTPNTPNVPNTPNTPNVPNTPNIPSTPSSVKVVGVKINGENEVYVGKSITLTATITPNNATNKNVTWKSSNDQIATVSSNGVVRGIKEGEVTITVTTEDGQHSDTYRVTVKSVYKLLLKAVNSGLEGTVMQYTATVTRDGAIFTDFTSVIIGTHTYRLKNGNNTVKASDIIGNPSVTIKLPSGATKTATLQFI